MRKLFVICAAGLMLASCSFFDSGQEGNTTTSSDTPGGNSGNGSGNGSGGSGTNTGTSANPYSDVLKGWRCVSYYNDKKTFDSTLEFHYDERGHLDYYLEHTLSYENDGIKVWSDDNYKRIYHYTSPTHADYYEDRVEGNKSTNWYNFDSEGRITEKFNYYGDNYLYHYNDKGQLIEIENSFQYKDEDDEKEYGSWKKTRIIEWTDLGCPHYFCQKWTSGTQSVVRNEMTILFDTAYKNPFREMAIDPTVMEMTIDFGSGGIGLFDMEGWWGRRSEYLITGWYSKENSARRVDVRLTTDRDKHIIGMTRAISNGGLDSRREYTFIWKGEAPLFEQNGIPVIN